MVGLRVLIVDDQELVRACFSVILQSEPGITVVGAARNGEEAVDRVLELRPDVVCMDVQMPIMDVQMPIMDGLEAARQISVKAPGTGVLILTTFDRDDYLFDALTAGASGFCSRIRPPKSSSKRCRSSAAATLCWIRMSPAGSSSGALTAQRRYPPPASHSTT